MIIFDHGDNIVHMGKTIAQKGAHVVKDGIRRKTAVGDTAKAYFDPWAGVLAFFPQQRKLMGSSAQISSGVCRCGSRGRFRKVPESSGVCWCRFRRRVPEGSGVKWCRFRRQGSEGSGVFRCGLLACNLDRSSHIITGITLSTQAKLLRKKAPM